MKYQKIILYFSFFITIFILLYSFYFIKEDIISVILGEKHLLQKRIRFLYYEFSSNWGTSSIHDYYSQFGSFPPGRTYIGYLTPEILSRDPKSFNYMIDPFVPGKFRGYSAVGYNWFEDKEIKYGYMKGNLLRYLTDGDNFYILISAGPDGIYEEIPEGDIKQINDILLYDPTNGLFSRGDYISFYGDGFPKLSRYNRNIYRSIKNNIYE